MFSDTADWSATAVIYPLASVPPVALDFPDWTDGYVDLTSNPGSTADFPDWTKAFISAAGPQLVSHSSDSVTGGLSPGPQTSSTVAAPASIAAGNLLVAFVCTGGWTVPFGGTVTPPAGWTHLGGQQYGAGSSLEPQVDVFSKVATGSEPATYTFSWQNQALYFVALVNLSGAAVDAGPAFATASADHVLAPSLNASTPDDLWLALGYECRNSDHYLTPAGFTIVEQGSGTGSGGPGPLMGLLAIKALTASGPTGTADFQTAGPSTEDMIACSVLIQ